MSAPPPPPPISHQSQSSSSSSSHSSRKSSKMSGGGAVGGASSSAGGYPQFLRPFHPAEAALAQEQLHSGMGRFDFGGGGGGGVVTSAPPPPPLHPGLSVPQPSPGPSSSSPSPSSAGGGPGGVAGGAAVPLVGQSDPRSLHQQFSCMLAANQYFLSGVPTNSSLEQFLVQQGTHNHLGLGLGQGSGEPNPGLAPPPALHSSHGHAHSGPQQQQQQQLSSHSLSHPHGHAHHPHPLHPAPQPAPLGGFDFQGIPVLSSNQIASLMQQEAGLPLPLPLHLSLSKEEAAKAGDSSSSASSGGSRRKKAMAGYLPRRRKVGVEPSGHSSHAHSSHAHSSGGGVGNCHNSSSSSGGHGSASSLVGGAGDPHHSTHHSATSSQQQQSSSTVSSSSSSAPPSSNPTSVLVANGNQPKPQESHPGGSGPSGGGGGPGPAEPEALYHCGECGKTFTHLSSLRRHLQSTSLLNHAASGACGKPPRSAKPRPGGGGGGGGSGGANPGGSGGKGGGGDSSGGMSNNNNNNNNNKYGSTDYSRGRYQGHTPYGGGVDDYRRSVYSSPDGSLGNGMSGQTLRKAPLAPTLHPHPQSQHHHQHHQHHHQQQQPPPPPQQQHLPLSSLLDDSEDEVTSSAMSAIAAAAAASCDITSEGREERRDIIGGLLGGLGFGPLGPSGGLGGTTMPLGAAGPDKSYRCDACGKSFAYSNSLVRHKLSQHGGGGQRGAAPPPGAAAAGFSPPGYYERGGGAYPPLQQGVAGQQQQQHPFQYGSKASARGGRGQTRKQRKKKRRVVIHSIMRDGKLVGVPLSKATRRKLLLLRRKRGKMQAQLNRKKLLAQLRIKGPGGGGNLKVRTWCGGPVKVTGLTSMEVPLKRFPCPVCPGAVYSRRAALLLHRATRHPPCASARPARLRCLACGRRSSTLRRALRHRGHHLRQGAFRCQRCRHRFWNARLLARHRFSCRGMTGGGSGNWGLMKVKSPSGQQDPAPAPQAADTPEGPLAPPLHPRGHTPPPPPLVDMPVAMPILAQVPAERSTVLTEYSQ
ncbi:hypothetical protein CRUP_015225 [Coryphaenoides rupestris]|nr:hypothetical protein CRUP_015225 [Coryphaenoides rupestris]